MVKVAVRLALTFSLVLASVSIRASIKNPFLASDSPAWTMAVDWASKLRALSTETEGLELALSQFSSLAHTRLMFCNGTHPYCLKQAGRNTLVEEYNSDGTKYLVETSRYTAEKAQYDSTTTTKENPATMHAWYQRLYARWEVLEDWRKRRATQLAGFKNLDLEIQSEYDRAYSDFSSDAEKFNHVADRTIKIADFDSQLGALSAKMRIDRRSLDDYQRTVPGFHEDVEKMAEKAEEARNESREKSLDALIGLALDGAIQQANTRETVTRAKLLQVKQALISNGVKPSDAKKILAGWLETRDAVKTIRHTKEMYERLGRLKEVASTYSSYDQHKYMEAAATCLGMFVKTPLLKLAVTNFDVYTNLMYTGLSYKLASDRVRQFDTLSESELKAVASLSDVYVKHIKAQKELKKQRDDLAASPIE